MGSRCNTLRNPKRKRSIVFFWLKKETTAEQLEALEKKQKIALRVKVHPVSGLRYVNVHIGVGDMTAKVSPELETLIEEVSDWDSFETQPYTEGMYYHWSTMIVIKNEGKGQTLKIFGPSVAEVNIAYSLLRQKKLTPEENWGV